MAGDPFFRGTFIRMHELLVLPVRNEAATKMIPQEADEWLLLQMNHVWKILKMVNHINYPYFETDIQFMVVDG